MRVIALLLLLAACGRTLTESEANFATAFYGQQINPDVVRIHEGLLTGSLTFSAPAPPRVTCRDRAFPPPRTDIVTLRPTGFTLFEDVFLRADLYAEDYLSGYPDRIDLWDVMLFAHEMVHVWQWQNRAVTGYHPLMAAGEHIEVKDPYLFDLSTRAAFLDYGYEQQGAIVEEYICCSALAPSAPRTARLRAMLEGAFAVDGFDAALSRSDVYVRWRDIEVQGICD